VYGAMRGGAAGEPGRSLSGFHAERGKEIGRRSAARRRAAGKIEKGPRQESGGAVSRDRYGPALGTGKVAAEIVAMIGRAPFFCRPCRCD
jgi:hypothetical protein